MKQNSELRTIARQALKGNWTEAVLAILITIAVSSILNASCHFGGVLSFGETYGSNASLIGTLICLPLEYACTVIFLKLIRTREINLKDIFAYYNMKVFTTMLLRMVYVILWALLLLIPGIVKSYSYAMTEYIMLDNPDLQNNAAIEKSMEMMKGHKMKLFLLDLSFIGWIILGILTFGIGIFFVAPYMQTARAAFYEDLKNNA